MVMERGGWSSEEESNRAKSTAGRSEIIAQSTQ